MKETTIEIPAGCEVEKIETQDGHVVVTFKEKERKLPKSWEEFCEMYPIKIDECRILAHGAIQRFTYSIPREIYHVELLPDRATAEAVLALCHLIQLPKNNVTSYSRR